MGVPDPCPDLGSTGYLVDLLDPVKLLKLS